MKTSAIISTYMTIEKKEKKECCVKELFKLFKK